MSEYQVTDKLIKLLEDLAFNKTVEEIAMDSGEHYFNIYDRSGGNTDDAYYLGKETGEIEMARTVLHLLRGGK